MGNFLVGNERSGEFFCDTEKVGLSSIHSNCIRGAIFLRAQMTASRVRIQRVVAISKLATAIPEYTFELRQINVHREKTTDKAFEAYSVFRPKEF
ncbi:MAG: hypothetical protein GY945_00885 [Rhodobacteraceae bacterium]|nr:hypothetical protein [Paracoccaceae bacterium]